MCQELAEAGNPQSSGIGGLWTKGAAMLSATALEAGPW